MSSPISSPATVPNSSVLPSSSSSLSRLKLPHDTIGSLDSFRKGDRIVVDPCGHSFNKGSWDRYGEEVAGSTVACPLSKAMVPKELPCNLALEELLAIVDVDRDPLTSPRNLLDDPNEEFLIQNMRDSLTSFRVGHVDIKKSLSTSAVDEIHGTLIAEEKLELQRLRIELRSALKSSTELQATFVEANKGKLQAEKKLDVLQGQVDGLIEKNALLKKRVKKLRETKKSLKKDNISQEAETKQLQAPTPVAAKKSFLLWLPAWLRRFAYFIFPRKQAQIEPR